MRAKATSPAVVGAWKPSTKISAEICAPTRKSTPSGRVSESAPQSVNHAPSAREHAAGSCERFSSKVPTSPPTRHAPTSSGVRAGDRCVSGRVTITAASIASDGEGQS